jgi:hypothetical protein
MSKDNSFSTELCKLVFFFVSRSASSDGRRFRTIYDIMDAITNSVALIIKMPRLLTVRSTSVIPIRDNMYKVNTVRHAVLNIISAKPPYSRSLVSVVKRRFFNKTTTSE